MAHRLKHLPPMWETWVQSLGWEDPLEKEMVTLSSILARRIPWTEEPGRLQSMVSQRVRQDWATSLSLSVYLIGLLHGSWEYTVMNESLNFLYIIHNYVHIYNRVLIILWVQEKTPVMTGWHAFMFIHLQERGGTQERSSTIIQFLESKS